MRFALVAQAIAWVGALLMGGCGGGDSSNEPTVVLDSPTSIQSQIVQGMRTPNAQLTGRMTGNLSGVSTIYVIVEDTARLFETQPSVSFAPNGTNSISVWLSGAPQTSSGRKTGQLRIHACRDMSCNQPYGGSPLRVPYDVEVLPGLSLSTSRVRVESAFGDAVPAQAVAVSLPANLISWQVETQVYTSSDLATVGTRNLPDGSGAIDITPQTNGPGTYLGLYRVETTSRLPSGEIVTATASLQLDHVVRSSSVSHAFAPSSYHVTRVQGDMYSQSFTLPRVALNTGASATFRTVEHLSRPPAAQGNVLAESWLQPSYTAACVNGFSTSNGLPYVACLPTGRYEARLVYEVTFQGVTSNAYVPVSLDVTP